MRFSFRFAYRAEQGDGFHPDASRSFLKCELVKNRPLRYRESWTTVVTISHASPLSSCVPLKYSVRIAFALYGTPFLRRYPGRMPVVTTFSEPPSTGAAPRRPPPPGSQIAGEWPCHVCWPPPRCADVKDTKAATSTHTTKDTKAARFIAAPPRRSPACPAASNGTRGTSFPRRPSPPLRESRSASRTR